MDRMPRLYDNVQDEARAVGLRAVHIRNLSYDTTNQYYDDRFTQASVWSILAELRNNNPDEDYGVMMSLPGEGITDVAVQNNRELRNFIADLMGEESDKMDLIFNRREEFPIELDIYRFDIDPFGVPGNNFMAGTYSRIWGPLGRVNNCVIKQISDRICYWLYNGQKRDYMWRDNGKISTDRNSEDYDADACKKLSMDKTYREIKAGVSRFLASRDLESEDSFGFDVRDLCELAELCGIRIMVYMNTRIGSMLRWDTDDKVTHDKQYDKRYVFKFFMTNRQHVELAAEEDLATRTLIRSSFAKTINYVGDDWFEELFSTGYPGSRNPESLEDCRVYTVLRSCVRWPLPEIAKRYRYSDIVIQDGTDVYKHEVHRSWISEETDLDPEDPQTADIICLADIHYKQLLKGYAHHNMYKISQRRAPSLFEAVAYADKMCTHTLSWEVLVGQDVYEIDGYKWYATDFSKAENFPYFHGYPASDVWPEYRGKETRPVYDQATGTFMPKSTYIGNFEGDRPFTFEYGKYAIFLIEELDLSGCDRNFLDHLARDKLLTDFEPSKDVLVLASPVLHFFQDQGVKWRASHLWVCYGCVHDWILGEGGQTGEILRREMIQHKTYAISAGKNMAGRWPVMGTKYITADESTANDLLRWYSASWCAPPESEDFVYSGISRRHAARNLLYGERNDVYGSVTVSGSTLSRGGTMTRRADGQGPSDTGPYVVNCTTDMYGTGKTFAHVSGALHAYAFVRLYQAASKLPADEILGFSLDSIKTRTDPTRVLGEGFIRASHEHGMFRPPVVKTVESVFRSKTCLLSNLYTPRSAFQGFAAPDPNKPLWGPYQDSLGQFNVVSGPAGSGKTWRHFRAYGDSDFRLDTDTVLYAPLTNYLAALLKTQGINSTTSFKAFNRRVDDAATVRDAQSRYVSDKEEQRTRLMGVATVLRDEVTQDSAAMILDAIRCCEANHKQLLLVGDLTKDRFYQLSAVRNGGPELFSRALEEAERDVLYERKSIKWIPPMRVFRQQGDTELTELLNGLREAEGTPDETWRTLVESPLFEHITYEEMLERLDPSKDLVANPWHVNIGEVTGEVLCRMAPQDKLRLRANFQRPYKPKPSDPECIRRMVLFEGDPHAHKGVTVDITKAELEALKTTKFMASGYPYAGSTSNGNMVNPMIGCSVFCLQGITLDPESTLYITTGDDRAFEWKNEDQPNQAYVTGSRARHRGQIKIVTRGGQGDRSRRRVA